MAISNQTVIKKLESSEAYFADLLYKKIEAENYGLDYNCNKDCNSDDLYYLIDALRYRVDRELYDETTYNLYNCLLRLIPFDLYDSVVDPNYISIPGIIISDGSIVYNSFLDLTDTPDTYLSNGSSLVYVNPNEQELSFFSLKSKTLVSPTISPTWTLKKNDGTTPYNPPTSNSKNIIVDLGVIASINANYQYPSPSTTEALPTAVTGSFGTTLPAPNTPSTTLVQSNVISNTTYTVNLTKPKSGLIVVGGQVDFASGVDTTTDSISISFQGRSYLGYSTNTILSPSDILALANKAFATSKVRTISGVTAGVGQYTYIVYNTSFGTLNNIIMDGAAPVLGAFTQLANVTVVNDAGLSVPMIVYKSNATNAFTNNTLALS